METGACTPMQCFGFVLSLGEEVFMRLSCEHEEVRERERRGGGEGKGVKREKR